MHIQNIFPPILPQHRPNIASKVKLILRQYSQSTNIAYKNTGYERIYAYIRAVTIMTHKTSDCRSKLNTLLSITNE